MQGEPVLAVLDVGLAGHGVEVGLQGELEVAATGLDLHNVTKQTIVIGQILQTKKKQQLKGGGGESCRHCEH